MVGITPSMSTSTVGWKEGKQQTGKQASQATTKKKGPASQLAIKPAYKEQRLQCRSRVGASEKDLAALAIWLTM